MKEGLTRTVTHTQADIYSWCLPGQEESGFFKGVTSEKTIKLEYMAMSI